MEKKIEFFFSQQAAENAIATVTNLTPESILPALIKKCTQFLETNDMISITEEQYKIYLTPEGELYNKSIITE